MLSSAQIEAFYHDEFVADQVRDFVALHQGEVPAAGVVVDIGGGCGFFARALNETTGRSVRVIDSDQESIAHCKASGITGVIGDALDPPTGDDEGEASFNLILHHLVGSTEAKTRQLQLDALRKWRGRVSSVFVNEYIYESWLSNLSGRLIFEITKSTLLSGMIGAAARVIPALKANTLGVGVRFRAHDEWQRLFREAGYQVKGVRIGENEPIATLWRLLLIRAIRRDSFLLVPLAVLA